MSSAEIDRRAVRLALGLTIAGAVMLTAGVAIWVITTLGRVTSGLAASDLRLASLVLLAGGGACGAGMGFALASAGRARPGGQAPARGTGLTPGAPEYAGPAPSLAEPRSLMNPPPPDPPPLGPPPEDARPADRVWWRAARSPAGGNDTSEEWLRSLRGPAVQQPPPHSAE